MLDRSPLEKFCRYLQYEKRYSAHTLLAYRTDLEQFLGYCECTYELVDYRQIDRGIIRSWMVAQLGEGDQARTVNRKLSAVRSFFRFLMREGVVSSSPATHLQSLKTGRRIPQFVREEQMKLVVNASYSEEPQRFSQVRDAFLIYTLYSLGLRRSELIQLHISDFDLVRRVVRIKGKGDKVRLLPLSEDFRSAYERYRALRADAYADIGYLFVSDRGKPMNPRKVYEIVRKMLATVPEVEAKGPHTIRHSFATHLLNRGADLHAISELLGHASLAATQVYTHNSIEKLKKVYGKAHPKA